MEKAKKHDLPIEEPDFIRMVQSLSGKRGVYDVWNDFIGICACTISNAVDKVRFSVRERAYLDTVKKYTKEELSTMSKLFAAVVLALERDPAQDFLGSIYTHLRLQQ